MVHRLVLGFDGTWDTAPRERPLLRVIETNVLRFYDSVVSGQLPGGSEQTKWFAYSNANWYERVSSTTFGYGIDQEIKDAHRWLATNYPDPDPGDREVFVFGYSRGAYEARSLVGMIRNVGLLLPEHLHRIDEAYAIYRRPDDGPDTMEAESFRARYSREIMITFLGVWETIGALGMPHFVLHWLGQPEYAFHDTELSKIVENAAQALAIDENRVDYVPALWLPIIKDGQRVEQRWFIGAHANVGGGYRDRRLSDITLKWMQEQAIAARLVIDPGAIPQDIEKNWQADGVDTYGQFLGGVYARTHEPFYRPMQLGYGHSEVVDESVRKKVEAKTGYNPKNVGFRFDVGPPNPCASPPPSRRRGTRSPHKRQQPKHDT